MPKYRLGLSIEDPITGESLAEWHTGTDSLGGLENQAALMARALVLALAQKNIEKERERSSA